MTLIDGYCDFCDNKGLLVTGDEDSVVFSVDGANSLVWCGTCRAGSLAYFKHLPTQEIVDLIEHATTVLENDPITDGEDYRSRVQKIHIEDDIYRAKRELLFRINEMSAFLDTDTST